jgi:hypothetical protein
VRLLDCEPKWLLKDGKRVGFIFRSPTKPQCWQSCFETPPSEKEQYRLFHAVLGGDDDDRDYGRSDVQACEPKARWTITPAIAVADFASLSVKPSLDGSKGGNWHGFITNGQIVGGGV